MGYCSISEADSVEAAMVIIRKAKLRDVPQLIEIINNFARKKILLPRTSSDMCERIREMTVAEEKDVIVGCAALHFYGSETAEIRSLAILPTTQRRGLGQKLTECLLKEAAEQELKCVFALTLIPEYFARLGFTEVSRETLPMKVWRDCIHCEKYFQCDEKAVVHFLDENKYTEIDGNQTLVKV